MKQSSKIRYLRSKQGTFVSFILGAAPRKGTRQETLRHLRRGLTVMSTRRLNSSSQSLLSFTSLIHRDTNGRVNAFAPGAPSRHYYTRAQAYNFIRKTLRSDIYINKGIYYIYLKM
jgi:hypothetical protein